MDITDQEKQSYEAHYLVIKSALATMMRQVKQCPLASGAFIEACIVAAGTMWVGQLDAHEEELDDQSLFEYRDSFFEILETAQAEVN